MDDLVLRADRDGVCQLTLNRPDKLNALNVDLFKALEAHVADLEAAPVWGLSQRLPRRVGTYKAREMMFTCRTYSGRQAETIGLANACVTDAEFEAAVDSLTAEILANSSFSHAANKRLLTETDGLSQPAGLAHEVYRSQGAGPDMADRIRQFTKRPIA